MTRSQRNYRLSIAALALVVIAAVAGGFVVRALEVAS